MKHTPLSPAKLATCQHYRIDNQSACCTECSEQMIGQTVTTQTVLSAPNLNPCRDPEHLRAMEAGEEFECHVPYVAGPAREVVIGYTVTYECSRCWQGPNTIMSSQEYSPACGQSHRGDLIRVRSGEHQ